jgi:hypothetical protein
LSSSDAEVIHLGGFELGAATGEAVPARWDLVEKGAARAPR